MTYLRSQQLKPEDFKRLCGVHHQTFTRMVSVLEELFKQKKKKPGKPSKLSIKDQVLISLEYWREYRAYFHNFGLLSGFGDPMAGSRSLPLGN